MGKRSGFLSPLLLRESQATTAMKLHLGVASAVTMTLPTKLATPLPSALLRFSQLMATMRLTALHRLCRCRVSWRLDVPTA